MALSSNFLCLPREIRDQIYGYVINTERVHRFRDIGFVHDNHVLKARCRIILASRQIHDEYLETMRKVAFSAGGTTVLRMAVTDTDFTKLINIVGNLSQGAIVAISVRQGLCVELGFTASGKVDLHSVSRWSQLCRTLGLKAVYEADDFYCRGDSRAKLNTLASLPEHADSKSEEGKIYHAVRRMRLNKRERDSLGRTTNGRTARRIGP